MINVSNIVERISDAAVDGVFRGLRYMFLYKSYVNDLSSEIEKVDIELHEVSARAEVERNNGKIIKDHVLRWLDNVIEIQESSKEFLNRTSRRPNPDFVSRFRIGREAVKKTKILVALGYSGKEILARDIAYLPPVTNIPQLDTSLLNIRSREYEKVWQGLTTEGSPLIHGIYGMAGVGKTRMAEQICKEAHEKKIFDKVVMIVAVGNFDDIQWRIARHLGLNFNPQDSVETRASQLKNSLTEVSKILIILDDVWSEIPLDAIGISFGDHEGSKILLTSRDEYVCLQNNCQHPVEIGTLECNEAWNMFRDIVGIGTLDSLRDKSLAKDVCTKCAGLPLFIQLLGTALKFRPQVRWVDALNILKKDDGIEWNIDNVWEVLFDNLVEDAAPCLFLCSLYPEGDDIPIRSLIQLAAGSQLVHSGRSRVSALVDILKSSSLLFDGKDDEHVILSATLRKVARSMAETDPKHAFLFATCGSRLPDRDDYNTRKLIHLDLEKNDFQFPENLVCPALHTLSLRSIGVAEPNLFPEVCKHINFYTFYLFLVLLIF